jgi:hypothetical protein
LPFVATTPILWTFPALASTSPAPAIFGKFYWDMGTVALVALAVAGAAAILRHLRDEGYLSDRWRFWEECDRD